MKPKTSKKKSAGIAARKIEEKRRLDLPYKAVGLGLLLWLLVTWLFFGRGIAPQINIVEGETVPATVEALVDFQCENLRETDLARKQEANKVPPVFSIDPTAAQRATKKIQALFDRLAGIAAAGAEERGEKIASLDDLLIGSNVDTAQFIAAFPTNDIAQAKTVIVQGIRQVMGAGIMSDGYRENLSNESPERRLSILPGANAPERSISLAEIYSRRTAVWAIAEKIGNPDQRKVVETLLYSVIEDNMAYDKTYTESLKKQASDKVPPVIQRYPTGTILVRAGERATPQTLLLLQQHAQKRQEQREAVEQLREIVGNGLLLLLGLAATAVVLRVGNPQMVRQSDKLLLLAVLSLFTLGSARLLTYLSGQYALVSSSLATYLVPHALAVLLAGILLGGGPAICLGFWTSYATAVLFDKSFSVFALGMLITITATCTARNVHRRSSLFRAGLWVCAVMVLYVLVAAILKNQALSVLVGQLAAAIVSGMVSTILALLLIPVFEKLFKITTDITLLELSDMGHPLLQKMAIQAPGTYHHSLMVATLAQNAAEAIGANSLLVRVCAYYHDIGKLAKPEFFTENIQHKENPHDELSPHMSALVISSHVKEGLTLARRHRLPQPIMDAIEQHHGNGLISFFYHKARQQTDGETKSVERINESDFRYGGAPAVTPEMSILSLADASEAASRSIEKPTPQKIANLINDIFAMKIKDGQMDYAQLTMAQINAVRQSFIFSLSNMLHGRIPYPKENGSSPKAPAADARQPAKDA